MGQDPTDHSVWITYTDERRTIGWVHLNEPWILSREWVPLATLDRE